MVDLLFCQGWLGRIVFILHEISMRTHAGFGFEVATLADPAGLGPDDLTLVQEWKAGADKETQGLSDVVNSGEHSKLARQLCTNSAPHCRACRPPGMEPCVSRPHKKNLETYFRKRLEIRAVQRQQANNSRTWAGAAP